MLKHKTEKPTATEKRALRDWLVARGVKLADAKRIARETDTQATHKQITDDVIAHCKSLPKRKAA